MNSNEILEQLKALKDRIESYIKTNKKKSNLIGIVFVLLSCTFMFFLPHLIGTGNSPKEIKNIRKSFPKQIPSPNSKPAIKSEVTEKRPNQSGQKNLEDEKRPQGKVPLEKLPTSKKHKILKSIESKIQLANFIKETKVIPLAPKGYKTKVFQESHKNVNAFSAFHPRKDVEINTVVSQVPLDEEDLENAAFEIVNISGDEFYPVKDHKLSHPKLEKIVVFEYDDENPIYAVHAKIKNSTKEVLITVHGKGSDMKSELEAIKREFSKMEIK